MISLAVLAAYFAALAALGAAAARRRRHGLDDFVVAGRALTLPLLVASLVPTFYGGVLGIGEFAWQQGLVNWLAMGFPYYVCAGLYAALLAGRIRLAEGLTIPDHLERAYGRPLALFGAWLVFLLACPADELLMVGTLSAHLLGVAPAAAMACAGALCVALLWRGGLRADVWTNALQFVVMFAGFAVILPFAAARLPPRALPAALPAAHLAPLGTLSPLRLAGWWLIAVWTFVDPAFHQRCAAAESPAAARRGVWTAIGFWALFDLMTTSAGLYARALLPALDRPLLAFPLLADRLLPALPRALFYAGLASSMLAALQGTALLAAISLGKDLAARLWGGDGERAARLALAPALLAAFALATALPSVVGLWYAVGSSVIPGLLLPLFGVYFPGLRRAPRAALAASASGWLLSTAWLLAGQRLGRPPLGVEPMFPGLALSALVWLAAPTRR